MRTTQNWGKKIKLSSSYAAHIFSLSLSLFSFLSALRPSMFLLFIRIADVCVFQLRVLHANDWRVQKERARGPLSKMVIHLALIAVSMSPYYLRLTRYPAMAFHRDFFSDGFASPKKKKKKLKERTRIFKSSDFLFIHFINQFRKRENGIPSRVGAMTQSLP